MFRRFLIALALIMGFQLIPVFDVLHAPVAHAVNPAPGEDIDSTTFMFDLNALTHEKIQGSTRQSWIRGGINYFFERAIGFMATVIGSLAVLMLSIGGFMMLASGGDENMYNKGKGFAKYSLMGLVVTLSAYILVTLVQLLISSIYA